MSQSYGKLKGGTTDEAFQEQCFLWERGALVGLFLTLKTFYKHKKWCETLNEKLKKKESYCFEERYVSVSSSLAAAVEAMAIMNAVKLTMLSLIVLFLIYLAIR